MAMDTFKETVKYARSLEGEKGKAFRFTMTTNGVLLNQENIDYIKEHTTKNEDFIRTMARLESKIDHYCSR